MPKLSDLTMEGKSVIGTWFYKVDEGTHGRITPFKATSLFQEFWPQEMDAVVTGIGSDGYPNGSVVRSKNGKVVVAAVDADWDYYLSATPRHYPVAIVYAYRCRFVDYDVSRDLSKRGLWRIFNL